VAFAHAALFSPTISTLDKALAKGFIPLIPGLTRPTLKKHPPNLLNTIEGHLDSARKNYRTIRPNEVEETDEDKFPASNPGNIRTHSMFLSTFPTKNTLYTDQTGAYPITSNREVKYLFCAYDYDSNKIFMRGLRNKTKEALIKAHQQIQITYQGRMQTSLPSS
jgi:hypothetical protein